MKSIFITLLMFVVALGAMHVGVFDVMSSSYAMIVAGSLLVIVFIFALKVLGNPFAKDEKNDKEQN